MYAAPGFIGHYVNPVLLPNPAIYAGRTASVEYTLGIATTVFSDGSAWAPVDSRTVVVSGSRDLVRSDNGCTLECTTTLTLTVPAGLPPNFGCAVMPTSGTTSVASSGGTLLNGALSTLTRTAASNILFGIVGKASAVDSYAVSGS